jgi:hypothetical protein
VALLLAVCFLTAGVVRRAGPRLLGDEAAAAGTVATALMAVFGALFAFLSAFLITNEWTAHNRAETAIANEAAAAARLGWAADAPGLDQQELLGQVDDYLRTTITDDWPAMADGALDSLPSDTRYRTLERGARSQATAGDVATPPASEVLAALDALAQGRRDRLVAAERTMPAAIFGMVLLSGLALVVNASVLTAARSKRAASLVGLLTLVVALDLALVLLISGPFRGSYVASPRPLERVVQQIDDGWFARP